MLFPPAFGEPPLRQTRDLVKLPFGYGSGSSTLAQWIEKKAHQQFGVWSHEYEEELGNEASREDNEL